MLIGMNRVRILCCLAFVGCTSPSPATDADQALKVGSGPAPEHLPGENVRRLPDEPGFVERYRYVLYGQRIGNGCQYYSRTVDSRPNEVEMVREEDMDRCIALRVVGAVKGYMPGPPVIESKDHIHRSAGSTKSP
jgi:hypothetical protein